MCCEEACESSEYSARFHRPHRTTRLFLCTANTKAISLSFDICSRSCIRYINSYLLRIQNMDPSFIVARLGQQVRQRRRSLGFTQAKLATLAGVTRQKVIAIERGDLSVGMAAYVRVVGALDCEFALVTAAMPTLDEIQGVFE